MAGYKLLKRKGLDHLTDDDDFSDFPLSSPATKIRRLDAELPPIAELEVEQDEPLPTPTPTPVAVEEAPNEERALVLFKPFVHSSSPLSLTLNSDLLSEIKTDQVPWSKQRDSDCDRLLRSAAEREEQEKRNRGMALVPWVPSTLTSTSQLGPILHQESNNTNMTELMEEADQMGAGAEAEAESSMMMDIEQEEGVISNSSADPIPASTVCGIGGIAAATTASEGFHQWQQQQQQHCLLPQLPQNISTPITWTR